MTPEAAPAAGYPLRAEVERQAEYARLLPLVKWLLAFPHYLVLVLLAIAAWFAILVSLFAVVITRRYPRGLFDFVVGVYRWGWRVSAYVMLMTDRYPPFTLRDDPAYPARLDVDYPEEGIDRWRPFVQWLLALPFLFAANLLQQLSGLMAFFAFFVILFTRRYPEGMFAIALVGMRWQVRGLAYVTWLTPRYPPIVWG